MIPAPAARVLLVPIAAALFACGGESDGTQAPAPPDPPSAPTPPDPDPPTPPDDVSPPSPAADDPCNPPEGELRGNAEDGAQTYQQFCALCHGKTGKGDGPGAPRNIQPRDHTDAGYMSTQSDTDLYRVVCGGGAAIGKSAQMPPWRGALTPDDMKNIISYLRKLSGT